ncbi:MAG TPA: hypothetical protein DCS60_00725 [Opitutae bacterium]|nr:hypothetical protein [Opitutae bacterium]
MRKSPKEFSLEFRLSVPLALHPFNSQIGLTSIPPKGILDHERFALKRSLAWKSLFPSFYRIQNSPRKELDLSKIRSMFDHSILSRV